jgi:Co/Zn/Cd efflux system component
MSADREQVLYGIHRRLREQHAVAHATVQIETTECLNDGGNRCHRA